MGSQGEVKGRAEQEQYVDREWKQTWACGRVMSNAVNAAHPMLQLCPTSLLMV